MKRLLFVFASFLLVLMACNPALQTGPLEISADKASFSMLHQGLVRTGALYVPAQLDPTQPISLVLALHGRTSKGSQFALNDLASFASLYNALIIYPDGIDGEWEIEPGKKGTNDDIGFFRRLIVEASAQFKVSPRRVYATGHSMGAMMSYRLGVELSDLISAIAPVNGVLTLFDPASLPAPQATALLHIHSADDQTVPLGGYPGYSMTVEESVDYWRQINQAIADPLTTKSDAVRTWDFDSGLAPTRFVANTQGGHKWLPGVSAKVMGFFYNYPARDLTVSFADESYSGIHNVANPIAVVPSISGNAVIERVSLMNGDQELAFSADPPYTLRYQTKVPIALTLDLIVTTKGGTKIAASNRQQITFLPAITVPVQEIKASGQEDPSMVPALLKDGQFTTRWASPSEDNQWLELDLGSAQTVKGLALFWEAAFASDYELFVSDNGVDWVSAVKQPQGKGGVELVNTSSLLGRYLKLALHKRASPWGFSLYEIIVF